MRWKVSWALGLGLAAVCVAGGAAAAEGPAAARTAFEEGLLAVPIYPVIKQYYPDIYKVILDQAVEGYSAGEPTITLQRKIRAAYLPLLHRELSKAEPRLIVGLIEITRDETESLANDPKACMAFIGVAVLEARIDTMVPPQLAQKELKLTAELLKQTATRPYVYDAARVANMPKAETLASMAYDRLPSDDSRKRFVQMGGRFADAKDPADQRVVCEYMVGFYEALLTQTPEDAAAVFTGATKAQ